MKVLVVDDQPEVVQGVLSGVDWKKAGIEAAFPAYSVKEAQEVFRREEIDILLCDIEMPPTDGFELLRWAQEQKPEVACIFLSAHAEFEYAREAVKLGSFDYILQPAPYEEIEKALERAVGKVRETEKLRRYYTYEDYRQRSADEKQEKSGEQSPVQRAMEFVRRNIGRDLSRAEIAEAIYLNPEYLSRLFKKETGGSLGDYIIAEKMRAAQSLLTDTNIPVGIVASKVGYSNFSYFSQVFKKHTGLSPVEYRGRRKKKLDHWNEMGTVEKEKP